MIEEIQSGITGLTNESLQELLSLVDLAIITACRQPTVGAYKYAYDLLDRIYVKVHMLLDEQDCKMINKIKDGFYAIYDNIINRLVIEDDKELASPTLREIYHINTLINLYNATILRGLQRKKYFFSTRGDAVNDLQYYDPFLKEIENAQKNQDTGG